MPELRDMDFNTDANVIEGWHFDDGTGTLASNWVSAPDGIFWPSGITAPTWDTTPDLSNGQITWNFGGNLSFDGTDDFATSPEMNAIEIQDFTLEMLVRRTSIGGSAAFLAYSPKGAAATGRGWIFSLNNSGIAFQVGQGLGVFDLIVSVGSLDFTAGYRYVALVYSATGTCDVYVQGQLVGSGTGETIEFSDGLAPTDFTALIVGGLKNAAGVPTSWAQIELADLRISNVLRTPAEISAMQEHLFPTAAAAQEAVPISPSGGAFTMTATPYAFYKNVRAAVGVYNNLSLNP
jgi:hypothetical protein